MTAPARRSGPKPRTPEQEWAYAVGMARLCSERGYHNLAQSYALAAADVVWTMQAKAQGVA